MKSIIVLIVVPTFCYLLLLALLYIFQRNLLFYPVPPVNGIAREAISFTNQGISLRGWVLNKAQLRTLVYYGGNSEDINAKIRFFDDLFERLLTRLNKKGKRNLKPSGSSYAP